MKNGWMPLALVLAFALASLGAWVGANGLVFGNVSVPISSVRPQVGQFLKYDGVRIKGAYVSSSFAQAEASLDYGGL